MIDHAEEVSSPFIEAVAALSARPDAPDVRVVTVAQLERWAVQYCADCVGYTQAKEEIRAIIGGPRK